MKAPIKETIKSALKGDPVALKSLLEEGERHLANNDADNAASILWESAVAFRIEAARQRSRADSFYTEQRLTEKVTEIYRQWIMDNTRGLQPLPYANFQINEDWLRKTIREMPPHIELLLIYLEKKLIKLGAARPCSSSSSERQLLALVQHYFGQPCMRLSEYLKDLDVRIYLDQIVSHVLQEMTDNEN